MNFIRNNGEVVPVNNKDVSKLEETEKYTLYGARHNPSGEQMVSVVYKNSGHAGDSFNPDMDAVMDPRMSDEEEELEAMPAMREIRDNPRKRISWKNLRLPSAISGEKAVKGRASRLIGAPITGFRQLTALVLSGEFDANTSIRGTPYMFMVRAEDWYNYITNMSTVDIGSEFAQGVTHAQRAGNALFAAEWQADPSHQNLVGRLLPGGDIQDATRKGQIAYDVLTRGRDILSQQGYGANNEEIMHGLVADIIRSMPVKQYNFYTLYNLHVDEGDKIYREFQSRYIPLDTAEVEMVLEMQRSLDAEGDAYAFRTTSNEEQGILASKMMRSAVLDYETGDTVSVRTILRALRDPPYNYRPRAVVISSASGSPETALRAADGKTSVYLELEVTDKTIITEMAESGAARQTSDKKIGVWVLGVEQHHLQEKNKNQIDNKYADRYKTLQIVQNQFDPTPQYLAVRAAKGKGGKSGGGNRWTIVDYAEGVLDTTKSDANRKKKSIRQGLAKDKSGGGYKGKKPRDNPKGAGRGKLHYVEIWPKTQITMKRREPAPGRAKGESRHGAGKLGKQGQTYWTKGVSKHLPSAQRLQMGTLKRTGEPAPYRIRFPTSYFKIVDHPNGYRTLEPKKDKKNKAFMKSWSEFTKFYGVPKHMPSKDTYNRFVIPKDEMLKSPYFQEVRSAAGKK